MTQSILIIDDDIVCQTLIAEIFRDAGYQVQQADDGRAAMALFNVEPADLVVTDIFMPEQDGIETIIALRQETFPPKMIAISGGGTQCGMDVLRLAKLLGADVALSKPVNPERLLDVARTLLEQQARERAAAWRWAPTSIRAA